MTADTNTNTHVIVGGGLAGAAAAAAAATTLREEGFNGGIVLIGAEDDAPYNRPPLSKEYLQGTAARDTIDVHPHQWYVDNHVDLRLGVTVTGIDPAAHEVSSDDGARIRYAELLLATGSSPRRLPVPGADLDGVEYLRTVGDSDRIKTLLGSAQRVAVIGAGWIGLEVAAAARLAGVAVTVLDTEPLPLLRVLGPEVAQVFADLHRAHGVDLRLGVQVAEIVPDGDGRARGVRLGDGALVAADAVIIGIGVAPNTALAQAAGLEMDNGVRVDAHLRSSDPDIYAAGDVANAFHPLLETHTRVEHWANALHGGPAAARAMLDQQAPFDRLPYFFTDQYDLGMEYTGHVEPGGYDQVVFRGDPATLEFVAFWLADGRVLAGMNVNIWDLTDDIAALVRGRRAVDPARLADPDVPLTEL